MINLFNKIRQIENKQKKMSNSHQSELLKRKTKINRSNYENKNLKLQDKVEKELSRHF